MTQKIKVLATKPGNLSYDSWGSYDDGNKATPKGCSPIPTGTS